MKHSLIQRMLCLALTLVMVLGMIPAGIIDFTVPVASAMTQAEKDEINAKWDLNIDFHPENPYATPLEKMAGESQGNMSTQAVSKDYYNSYENTYKWRQIFDGDYKCSGGNLRNYLESSDKDDKYIVLMEDVKCTSSHDDYQIIVIESDKVLDLNGHTIELYDKRNKVDTHGWATESYDQSTTMEDHHSYMFRITNGATLIIIDSRGAANTMTDSTTGEMSTISTEDTTGRIFANAMMINHQEWDLHYYTHRDIFHVTGGGKLVIYGGEFQAGRQKDQYKNGFSMDALKEVIGQTVVLGTSIMEYASGIDAADAAKQDFLDGYYENQKESGKDGDAGSDTGNTTKKDGKDDKTTKDTKQETPASTGGGDETKKKDETVASKQSKKNNPEDGETTKGDKSKGNKSDEKKPAKSELNTKTAEFNKTIATAALDKDKIMGMVNGAFDLGQGIYDLIKNDTDSRATACIQGTVAKVSAGGTLVIYGGHFIGHGSTENVRNAVIEVERLYDKNTNIKSLNYGKYEGGLVYVYDGEFDANTGANVFNLVRTNRDVKMDAYEKDENGNVKIVENVSLCQTETTNMEVLQFENLNAWLTAYNKKSSAEKEKDPGPALINTANVLVRGGTFRCHYELVNMSKITHEESKQKIEGQKGDLNFHRFTGTPGSINLGVESFGEDMIKDGRIQLVDVYGQGSLVLLDGGDPIDYGTSDGNEDNTLEGNAYQTEGGYRNYRLFVSDSELRTVSYLEVFPNQSQTNSGFSFNLMTYYGRGKSQEEAWESDDYNKRAPYSSNERFFEFPFDDLNEDENSGGAPTYFVVPNLKNTDPKGANLDSSSVWYYNVPADTDGNPIGDFSYGDTYMYCQRVGDNRMIYKVSYAKTKEGSGYLAEVNSWDEYNNNKFFGNRSYETVTYDAYRTNIKWFTYKVYRVDPLTRENISESDVYGVDEPLLQVVYGASNDSLKCRLGLMDLAAEIKRQRGDEWQGYQQGEMYRIVFSVEEHLGYGYKGAEADGELLYDGKLDTASAESSILFRCVSKDEQKLGTYTDPNTGVEKKGYLPDFTPLQFEHDEVLPNEYAEVKLVNGQTGLVDYLGTKVFDIYYQWWECDADGNDIRMIAGTDNIWIAQETSSGKDNHRPYNWVLDPTTGQGINGEQYYRTIDPNDPNANTYAANGLPADPKDWTYDMVHMYTQETCGGHYGMWQDTTKPHLTIANNNAMWGNTDTCYIPAELEGKYIKVKLIAVNCQYPLIYDNLQTIESHAMKVYSPEPVSKVNVYALMNYGAWTRLGKSETDGVTVTDTQWYVKNGSSFTPIDMLVNFEEGKTYRCKVTLAAEHGYVLTEDCAVTFSMGAGTKQSNNVYYIDYTVPTITASVDLAADRPISGFSPEVYPPSMDITTDSQIICTKAYWLEKDWLDDGSWQYVQPGEKFGLGGTYIAHYRLEAVNGTILPTAENFTVTVNGGAPFDFDKEYCGISYMPDRKSCWVWVEVNCADHLIIDGFKLPQAGQRANDHLNSLNLTMDTTLSGLTIEEIFWVTRNTKDWYNAKDFIFTGVFESGVTYYACLRIGGITRAPKSFRLYEKKATTQVRDDTTGDYYYWVAFTVDGEPRPTGNVSVTISNMNDRGNTIVKLLPLEEGINEYTNQYSIRPDDGGYTFKNVSCGRYKLQITGLCRETYTQEIVVTEGTTNYEVELTTKHNIVDGICTSCKLECKHVYSESTCKDPAVCIHCGMTSGYALGHDWVEATCETPKTCATCGATEGTVSGHNWIDATCAHAKYCSNCYETVGNVAAHSWVNADCNNPTYCSVCGETAGSALGHFFVSGACARCGVHDPSDVEPSVIPTLAGYSFSLSFEDEILINLYYTAANTDDILEQGMLVFYTDPGTADVAKADDVYIGSYVEASGMYIATTDGIAAKEMGDNRYYCVYAKLYDGTYAYSPLYQYSPRKYAMNMINKNSASAKLCIAMLNYGTAAQKFFGYKTDDLMNASLTDAQKAQVNAYDAGYFTGAVPADANKIGAFVSTSSGFQKTSVTVSFEGAFAVNYYFFPNAEVDGEMILYIWSPEDYKTASQLTAENAFSIVSMTKQADGSYWGQVSGIAAKNLDETYYVSAVYTDTQGNTHCRGVVAYSLSTYCMNNAKPGKNMQELAANTAMYGYYAKLYFAN